MLINPSDSNDTKPLSPLFTLDKSIEQPTVLQRRTIRLSRLQPPKVNRGQAQLIPQQHNVFTGEIVKRVNDNFVDVRLREGNVVRAKSIRKFQTGQMVAVGKDLKGNISLIEPGSEASKATFFAETRTVLLPGFGCSAYLYYYDPTTEAYVRNPDALITLNDVGKNNFLGSGNIVSVTSTDSSTWVILGSHGLTRWVKCKNDINANSTGVCIYEKDNVELQVEHKRMTKGHKLIKDTMCLIQYDVDVQKWFTIGWEC
jgi:hypothetical protein